MGVVPFENRYSVITEKNPREIVLLRGIGCSWRRCRFCDYHMDFSMDQKENDSLNARVLAAVRGLYRKLEVINSGSFTELGKQTLDAILNCCQEKNITQLHFESHWQHRNEIAALKDQFARSGITVKVKIGVETFDSLFRESYLDKGIDETNPQNIAVFFDEVCLLHGLPGQTEASMKADIETGLQYFERVCVNIMVSNTKPIQPDPRVIRCFRERILPLYQFNPRVDILLNNTDFGVGV